MYHGPPDTTGAQELVCGHTPCSRRPFGTKTPVYRTTHYEDLRRATARTRFVPGSGASTTKKFPTMPVKYTTLALGVLG